jgi:chromosome segregation ATPase
LRATIDRLNTAQGHERLRLVTSKREHQVTKVGAARALKAAQDEAEKEKKALLERVASAEQRLGAAEQRADDSRKQLETQSALLDTANAALDKLELKHINLQIYKVQLQDQLQDERKAHTKTKEESQKALKQVTKQMEKGRTLFRRNLNAQRPKYASSQYCLSHVYTRLLTFSAESLKQLAMNSPDTIRDLFRNEGQELPDGLTSLQAAQMVVAHFADDKVPEYPF